jgi:hypothetical protein
MFASFSKFNPALRTQLVSSLVGFNTDTNKSANFIKFYSADNVNQTAGTGDLLVDIIAPVHAVGYKANVVDPQDITDNFVYPGEATPQEAARSSTFSSNRAVAALKYSKKDGALKVALTPVVSGLEGSGGITITKDPATGNHTIGYLSEGYTGYVDSIEPINARLEFRGLTSYIKLPIANNKSYIYENKKINKLFISRIKKDYNGIIDETTLMLNIEDSLMNYLKSEQDVKMIMNEN